jgi:sulfatase modifying factor 1
MTVNSRLKGMVRIPDGSFLMGCHDFYPEERPVRLVRCGGFWMDEHAVTVAEYRRFVTATGYVTVAERAPDPAQYPAAAAAVLVPGSLVFAQPGGPVDLSDPRNWWSWVPGAWWRHPEGPESTLDGRDRHPVTQVAFDDAEAYAAWAGKELPSEVEWEFAARGGLEGVTYSWGDAFRPRGRVMANTWDGRFPWEYRGASGRPGTVPVKKYPPNGYGLYEMTGNVWEWTADSFALDPQADAPGCCGPGRRPPPDAHIPRRVVKGGSFLCAPNYCLRYRPAARQGQAVETSSSHLGFRCVIRGSSLPCGARSPQADGGEVGTDARRASPDVDAHDVIQVDGIPCDLGAAAGAKRTRRDLDRIPPRGAEPSAVGSDRDEGQRRGLD